MIGPAVFGCESLARSDTATDFPLLGLAVVAGVLLWRRDRSRPAPLLPIDLLRIPIFALSICTSLVSFAAQMLALVTLPFLLQSVLGRSVLQSGLLDLAVAARRRGDRAARGSSVGSLCRRHPRRHRSRRVLLGLLSLLLMGREPSTATVLLCMATCGAGFGFFQSPNNRTLVNAAPRERSGAAGGMLATARLLGQSAGAVAVAAGFHQLGVDSAHLLLRAAAVAAAVAAVISLLRMRVSK